MFIGTLYWANIKSGFTIEAVISMHEFLFSVIYGLIAIHIIAAVYHRFMQDGVWNSMVPFWKEESNLD
jgi:cytochrome b561